MKTKILFIQSILLIVCMRGDLMAFSLKSRAFSEASTLAVKYSCDGAELSPELIWSDAPSNTKSFALIMDDPDAPVGTWVHWVLYDLAPGTTELA
jgi:Raf kinase inhibitor-like YbhB/YbcL family protein